jgi:hypothetical protein
LLRCDLRLPHNWIKVRTIGTKSNRSGIGARILCVSQESGASSPRVQMDEVRSGGGYLSQSDLRVHFGLGKAQQVQTLEVRWPSGLVDTIHGFPANRLVYVKEGTGIVRTVEFPRAVGKAK